MGGEDKPVLFRIADREKEEYETPLRMETWKVGVIGLSEGAGASFLVMSLARFLANGRKHHPAVVELGKPSIFDSMGMDRHFPPNGFRSFFEMVKNGQSIRKQANMDEGINWILRSSRDSEIVLDPFEELRLLNNTSGDVILCDLSGRQPRRGTAFDGAVSGGGFGSLTVWQLLREMDSIVAVVDPLPSKLLSGYEFLQELRASGLPVTYVVNKDNPGVNRREMTDFLKLRHPVTLPALPLEGIYTAEYICKSPYSIPDIKKRLRASLTELAGQIL